MKKLFISCPMKNRSEENIRMTFDRLHKIAEAVYGESLEVIPNYIEDNPPKCRTEGLWYLGKSVELLAQADYFIGICGDNAFQYNGCTVEIVLQSCMAFQSILFRPFSPLLMLRKKNWFTTAQGN